MNNTIIINMHLIPFVLHNTEHEGKEFPLVTVEEEKELLCHFVTGILLQRSY